MILIFHSPSDYDFDFYLYPKVSYPHPRLRFEKWNFFTPLGTFHFPPNVFRFLWVFSRRLNRLCLGSKLSSLITKSLWRQNWKSLKIFRHPFHPPPLSVFSCDYEEQKRLPTNKSTQQKLKEMHLNN
jgi:hypothetical protein